jgi:NAD(P)-dependent dehydrogenase (short-subunit alcohol dehydrogenase family)
MNVPRVALVTGGMGGLGEAICIKLAALGYKVVTTHSPGNTKSKEWLDGMNKMGYGFRAYACDVADWDSCVACAQQVAAEVGPIDVLVNNSGVSNTRRLQDVSVDDYDFIFDTNVKGSFFVAQEVGKRMLARAQGAAPGTYVGGRIINIASVAALKVLPQIGVYCMSKAALVQMTKAMALEWGRFGINVNALCPGYIATELNEEHWVTDGGQKLVGMLPRKRVGKPEDLDGLIVLLASGQSHFVNGAVIAADDGFAL